MSKKIGLIVLCGIILLGVCGCDKKQAEQQTFQLEYIKKSNDLIIEGSSSTTYKLILPTNSNFLEDKKNLTRAFKFYDYANGEIVEDINYEIDFDTSKEGTYILNIIGKYNNMSADTKINVELIQGCSGDCVINTTNWNFELKGDYTYEERKYNDEYYNLKVKAILSPNESAFAEYETQETYEDFNDGNIDLYYKKSSYYSKIGASGKYSKDNALSSYFKINEKKENMFIYFYVVPKLDNVNVAFIDFYDKQAQKHNFYIIK